MHNITLYVLENQKCNEFGCLLSIRYHGQRFISHTHKNLIKIYKLLSNNWSFSDVSTCM